ncbi:MAG: hypothetical protein GY796_34335 [Chloroflexi bacterium]|nr:hypothetical protein [Chloroflexota bacterium]
MNRYAATLLGQPGVAQGAMSNPFATAFLHQLPGSALGLAINQSPVVGTQILGKLEITYLPSKGFQGFITRASQSSLGRQFPRLPLIGRKIAAYYASRYRRMIVPVRLDQGGTLADELLQGGSVVLNRYAAGRLIGSRTIEVVRGSYGVLFKNRALWAGSTFSGIIGGALQVYDDWDNPYLTGGQKTSRAIISTGISFTAAYAGAKIGAVIGTAIEPGGGTAIGTVAGAIIGFSLGLVGEMWGTPRIFELTGDVPERRLAPLP